MTLRGMPRTRFSPVAGLQGDSKTKDDHCEHIPLPVFGPHPGTGLPEISETLKILCVAKLAQLRKRHNLLLDTIDELAAEHKIACTLVGATTSAVSGYKEDFLSKLLDRLEQA